ncbi:MAG TPA: hypothetical protein VIV11_42015 [Kofleriaceae bacterium]
MRRREIAIVITAAALLAAIVVSLALPVTRTATFHRYADTATWLGIPNALNVLSNLPFLVAGAWFVLRAETIYARLASLGVVAIGIGSAAHHFAPGDVTLAFDFLPIVVTLMIVTAALIADRIGERAGLIALGVGVVLAIAVVVIWYAGGGTGGSVALDGRSRGSMTPYVAVQALGILLPTLLALVAPGTIPRVPLLVGVLLFAVARLCSANDHQILDAIGVSGHSLKHLAAAAAASCALYALTSRATLRAS